MFAVRKSAVLVLLAILGAGSVAAQPTQADKAVSPEPTPVVGSATRPASPQLQQQIQLNHLNQQVAAELQRIQGEVQIEEAKRGLEAVRDGNAPVLVGTFMTAKGRYAEFQIGGIAMELQVNEFVTPELRVSEVHRDRVILCKKAGRECKTYTPAMPGMTASAQQ